MVGGGGEMRYRLYKGQQGRTQLNACVIDLLIEYPFVEGG